MDVYTAHVTLSLNELGIQQQASSQISSTTGPLAVVPLSLAPSWSLLLSPSPVFTRLWGCPFPRWVARGALSHSWRADVLLKARSVSCCALQWWKLSPREDGNSHKNFQEDHMEGTDELILVLVQEHLEEQLWTTRMCLSLLCRKVVKRQGVQHDKIEICSHRPNLRWKIIE